MRRLLLVTVLAVGGCAGPGTRPLPPTIVESAPEPAVSIAAPEAAASAVAAPILEPPPPPPLSEGWRRFRATFSHPGYDATYRLAIPSEVRPPTIEWWLGWQLFGCVTEIEGGQPVYRCDFDIPADWGCAELRLRARATRQIDPDPLDPKYETVPSVGTSNVRWYGECPDPLPDRVPLATPEPSSGVSLTLGALLLCYLTRRRAGFTIGGPDA